MTSDQREWTIAKDVIKSKAEVKFTGDEYAGFYSCGLTMLGSSTMNRFSETEEDERVFYRTANGLQLEAATVKSERSDTYEIQTVIRNTSKEDVTLEMMTSFLFADVKADRIHRIQSFWSAEGRVRSDDLCDLNMEHSWNNMAYRVEKFGNVGSMPVRKYFPFVALEDSKTHSFFAVQLYSPASWQIEAVVRAGDAVTLSGGIADRDFGHWTKVLKPGDFFAAPKAVAAVGGSLEDVCVGNIVDLMEIFATNEILIRYDTFNSSQYKLVAYTRLEFPEMTLEVRRWSDKHQCVVLLDNTV